MGNKIMNKGNGIFVIIALLVAVILISKSGLFALVLPPFPVNTGSNFTSVQAVNLVAANGRNLTVFTLLYQDSAGGVSSPLQYYFPTNYSNKILVNEAIQNNTAQQNQTQNSFSIFSKNPCGNAVSCNAVRTYFTTMISLYSSVNIYITQRYTATLSTTTTSTTSTTTSSTTTICTNFGGIGCPVTTLTTTIKPQTQTNSSNNYMQPQTTNDPIQALLNWVQSIINSIFGI